MKLIKKVFMMSFVFLSIGIILIVGIGYNEYKEAVDDKPLKEKINEIQSSEKYVKYKDISPYLFDATISIEDKRFYKHNGIDYIATSRAMLSNLFYKEIISGGSTITQQLAKNLYFEYKPSLIRKIAEIFVVHELEEKYSKKEILELYVNIINYGDQYIGIYEAAEGYFHVTPKDLNLDQASLLAGIPQSPMNYQLSNHEKEARNRQKDILEAMIKDKKIDINQYLELIP